MMVKNISLYFALFYLLFSILSANCSPAKNDRVDEVTVTVNTTNGPVRGHRGYTLFDQKLFYSFKGIPYGQPPVGSLRFKPPQPAHSWNGVLDAENFGNICIQEGGVGAEDCLFLNVFSPNVSPLQKLPVLINIHGGGFIFGSPNDNGPDFLFNQADIIMISMNYRLGAFGFLTLGTPEYSGNMGLKDQQLAIKWVIENIDNFGGDPNQITLYGLSAGSVSVHNHIISESSNKLFQRAILASGSALNPFALASENHLARAIIFAEQNGVSTSDVNEIISFLHNADAALFFSPGSAMLPTPMVDNLNSMSNTWIPVIEPEGSFNPIIQKSPSDVLNNNFSTNIDTLFGVELEESLYFIDEQMRNPESLQPINESWNMLFPIYSINQNFDFTSEKYYEISARIRHYYFADQDIGLSTVPNYATAISDIMFNYGIDRSVRFHAGASNANTYYYRFSVDALLNIMKARTIAYAFGIAGATHVDDLFYTYRSSIPGVMTIYSLLHENSIERQTIDKLTKAFANFIVTGKPTSDFLPVQPNSFNFIDFTNDGAIASINPFHERMEFWDNLVQEFQLF